MARASKAVKRHKSSTTIISTETGSPLIVTIRKPSSPSGAKSPTKKANKSISITSQGNVSTQIITVENIALTPKFQAEVLSAVLSLKKFNSQQAGKAVQTYLALNFPASYYTRFCPKAIANHIVLFAAAKFTAKITKKAVDIQVEKNAAVLGGNTIGFYIIPTKNIEKRAQVEAKIATLIQSNVDVTTNGYTVDMFTSANKKYQLYLVQTDKYNNVDTIGKAVDTVTPENIANIALPNVKTDDKIVDILSTLAADINTPQCKFYTNDEKKVTTMMVAYSAFSITTPQAVDQLKFLTCIATENKVDIIRKQMYTFANNTIVIAIDFTPESVIDQLTFQQTFVNLLSVPQSTVLTPAVLNNTISTGEYIYLSIITKVLFYVIGSTNKELNALYAHFTTENDTIQLGKLRNLYTTIRREAITADRLESAFLQFIPLTQQLFTDFKTRQSTFFDKPGFNGEDNVQLEKDIKKAIPTVINNYNQEIFLTALNLNKYILKSNIFTSHLKQSLAIRINGDFFTTMDLPRLPFAVFFAMGANFQAFHIRFADVARGGIRLIIQRDLMYARARLNQFAESYNLAFTQNLKNKDIAPFGSKGTVLLQPTAPQSEGLPSFERFVNGLLDLLIQEKDTMIDNYGKLELLYLGPDEGTAGVMKWAALHSKKRGYKYPLAFTTGKPASLGGIPHDVYGMTTNSVHRYVVGALKKLGMNEEECTKAQTAGPDGDLGSNEIKISKDKTIAIIDGSGVLYDPNGIDRVELTKLAERRVMSNHFPKDKLSTNGWFVSVQDKDVTLPDGEVVPNGMNFRNDFHLHEKFTADLFVPCGGRPEAFNLGNIDRVIDPVTKKAKFKVIIEGANLFISQDARLLLEEAGVVLYKDASTNKGGVTSSSLEVLAALALPEDVFETKMAVHDPSNPPPAYHEYAMEIRQIIIENADLEFECIWNEHERTKLPRYILTDRISNKINELNDEIHAGELYNDQVVKNNVLPHVLPQTLQNLTSYQSVLDTAPDSYLKASFTAYLASRFVYKYGLDATMEQFNQWIDETYRK